MLSVLNLHYKTTDVIKFYYDDIIQTKISNTQLYDTVNVSN
jgi:hypothetical protein